MSSVSVVGERRAIEMTHIHTNADTPPYFTHRLGLRGSIVFGFGLFLYSEMKLRQIDRQMAENQRFIDAILRTQSQTNYTGQRYT